MHTRTIAVCGALALGAGHASSRPIMFTIDPSRSTIDLDITLSVDEIGDRTDSDSSPLSGFVLQALAPIAAPGSTTLYDFEATLNEQLQFVWDYGFLGSASAQLDMGSFFDADPAALNGPVPVTAGAATIPMVPVAGAGTLDVSYGFLLIGSGAEVIDLSTLDPSVADIDQTIETSAGVITISGSAPIDTTQPLEVDGSQIGTVTITGTLTLVATAPEPGCAADYNASGDTDFGDVNAFVAAFSSGDPIADLTGNGSVGFDDINAFVQGFAQGCP